jgi:hypothetical protein
MEHVTEPTRPSPSALNPDVIAAFLKRGQELLASGDFAAVPELPSARHWYEKAKEFGSEEASQRLEMLARRRCERYRASRMGDSGESGRPSSNLWAEVGKYSEI